MKRISLLVTLFIFSFRVSGADYFKANAELPNDFRLAVNFYQVNAPKDSPLIQDIPYLDQLLSQLTKEERLMILKSELYKGLLKSARSEAVETQAYRKNYTDQVKQGFAKIQSEKEVPPFIKWFMESLFIDIDKIQSDANYPNFMSEYSRGAGTISNASRKIKSRLDLLLPWLQWFQEGSLPGLKEKLLESSELSLRLSMERVQNLIFLSRFEGLPDKDTERKLSFFEPKTRPKVTDEKSEDSLEELLSEDESGGEEQATTESQPLDETWVPRMAPDPDYQAPEKLPEPVDDWLPEPVDDWLNDM